jgi:acyl-CoA synthetase (AMP-forming)/AMP-acid ligase II
VASVNVERVILGEPRVDQVAVVGLPDEKWVEAVTAWGGENLIAKKQYR